MIIPIIVVQWLRWTRIGLVLTVHIDFDQLYQLNAYTECRKMGKRGENCVTFELEKFWEKVVMYFI